GARKTESRGPALGSEQDLITLSFVQNSTGSQVCCSQVPWNGCYGVGSACVARRMAHLHCTDLFFGSRMEKGYANILLVDDEETDLSAIREALESEGYTVQAASNIPDALATYKAATGVIDLLIADISLPGGNGCDLAIAISKEQPSIRVLFI